MNTQELKKWELFVKKIQQSTYIKPETAAERAARMERFARDYNAFALHYFPHYCETDCAPYHLEMATHLLANPITTNLHIVYRGGAKSTHANLIIPAWLIFIHKQLRFMLVVGENENKANLLLRDIQAEMQYNKRLEADFGAQFQFGDWSDGEFKIKAGTLFMALGINQSARGLRNQNFRPDYISVDDVEDRKKANNPQIVQERVDKILGDLAGAFSKDYQRLVISNNFIHRKGVIATLLDELQTKPQTKVIWANALDADGQPTWPQRYSIDYWKAQRQNTREAQWQREYCNNPVEEGLIFKTEWLHYAAARPEDFQKIVVYGDLSYKAKGDFKAFVAVGKDKTTYTILKAFVKQTSLQKAIEFCYDYRAEVPESVVVEYWVEANFAQDMFIDAFYEEAAKREQHLYIKPDKRVKPEKFTRIEALSALFERGLIRIAHSERDSPDMQQLIDQLLLFERGSNAHDDAPDALEGAIHLLNKQAKTSEKPTLFAKIRRNIW